MYAEIEDEIVQRLAPLATSEVEVEAFPDVQAQYGRPQAKTRVTVQVHDDEAEGRIRDVGMIVQDNIVSIYVVVRSNKRRGANHVYAVAKAARILLLGFKLENCDRKIWYSNGQLLPSEDETKGTYTYVMKFMTQLPLVEDYAEDTLADALQQITVNSDFGSSETVDDELDGGDADDTGYDIEFDGNADD
jgi:hypothetical protein